MTIIGLDLGTRYVGVVVARDALPLHILTADTPEIGPGDAYYLGHVVRDLADRSGARDVVVEFGQLYIPADATPQKARAIAANHAEMAAMLSRIHDACQGPWYRVATIARRSWSCRVLPGVQGGISDADAMVGLAAHVDPACEWVRLVDKRGRLCQHRGDAAGAIVGHLLGAPRKGLARQARTRRERREAARDGEVVRVRVRLTPEQRKIRRKLRARKKRGPAVVARLARSCACGPGGGPKVGRGAHRWGCPCAPTSLPDAPPLVPLRERPERPKRRPCGCVWHGRADKGCRADHAAQTAQWLGTESERARWGKAG